MKNYLVVPLIILGLIALTLPGLTQFLPEEIAERPKWEEYLRDAEIIGQEQMGTRDAVTNPWVLTLDKDGIQKRALWKNPQGMMRGYIEGWKYEIAAYLFDKYLELNMVPPTVEKEFKGSAGSCQLWVDHWKSLRSIKEEKIKVPSIKIFYYNRALYLQRAFDNLIGNEDRHQNNYLFTEDWRMILIDHSRSFRTTKKFTTKLIYTEKHPEGPMVMRELPRALFEKIKALDYEMIKGFVGEYLDDKEINGVLARKDLIIKEIEKLIAQNGEEKVLY